MIDVKVRWNTQCTDNHSYWRVIIDGEEHICSNVILNIPTYTTRDEVWDSIRGDRVQKHHVSCKANNITWKGDVIIIE